MKLLRRKSLSPRIGPLAVLALLLVVSSLLRLAGGTGQAIAKEVGTIRAAQSAGSEPENCAPAPDIAAVLAALKERESRLSEREAYVATRSAALTAAEKAIADQITVLEQAEQKLEATLTVADSASETDIARLTAVYENMKPKEAAKLFETMAPSFAAGFLGRMRPEAAAKVIEGLSPEVAYSISAILAGRNAEVPKR